MKLEIGHISITTPAALALALADTHIFLLVARHALGDWDVTSKEANLRAIQEGEQVIGAYVLPGTGAEVWVVTNSSRTATSIMLAEEYR